MAAMGHHKTDFINFRIAEKCKINWKESGSDIW